MMMYFHPPLYNFTVRIDHQCQSFVRQLAVVNGLCC